MPSTSIERRQSVMASTRDCVWVDLVSNCYRWATNYMDQWEKFKFDTEHGPIYVTIRTEEEYPDSFDRVSIIGQSLDEESTDA